jgi:hypothetical protein
MNPKSPPERTKSGGQPSFPGFYFGGLVVRLCWRPGRSSRLKRRSRPVNGPLSLTSDSVKHFLQFYYVFFKNDGKTDV